MHTSLALQLPQIAALCEKHGVAHLDLFGSATGAEFNPDSSDFDFLVKLDTHIPGSRTRRWTELADALEQLLVDALGGYPQARWGRRMEILQCKI